MSEERIKKIQPFTIGTKLSVPAGARCQDFGDILPAPVSDDCKLKSTSFCQGQVQPTKHDPSPVEDCCEEERDSLYPSASSRSIRKIAICGSTETEDDGASVDPDQGHDPAEERRGEDGSVHPPHSESKPWRKRKMKNLPCDYGIPGLSLEHAEDASPSQQRDLKDFENSLIHLTTSLDLEKHDLEETALRKSSSGFGLEILGRRNSIGETFDKLWLKFRSLLQGYQQDLMLALDVSSFYQQADIIINTINTKRDIPHVGNVQCGLKDTERREISSQIKMLNESAARLSNLHPTLASQVTLKQAEVLQSWAVLQDALRNQRASKSPAVSPKGHGDPQTTSTESQCFTEFELHGVMGKNVKEEQNRLLESGILRPVDEFSSRSRSYCKLDSTPEKQIMDSKSKDQLAVSESFTHRKPLSVLAESTLSAAEDTWSWLKDNMSVQSGEDRGNLKQSKEHKGTKMEELLDQVEVLWEGLRKRYRHGADVDLAEKELKIDMAAQDVPALRNDFSVSECNEKFLDTPDDLNVRRYHVNHGQTNEDLLNMLSTVTLHINRHLSRCAELSMDILDMEIDMTMRHDLDFAGLEGLQEQQDDLEVDYRLVGGEVEDMEIQVRQLPVPPTEQGDLTEEVQSVLQAWEEVGRNMTENRERLATFRQLQDYFKTCLETIAWAETTKSWILSGSAALQSEAADIDHGIEQKLLELDNLAEAGQRLTEEGNYVAEIIKERTEELKSMLEWIQVNWKTQKQELSQNNTILENLNPVNNPCIKMGEEMQINEASQHFQLVSRDECLPDQKDVRSDDPGFVIQDPWSAQASLGSNICLILSFDEQSPLISQVCKELSPSSSELHMLPLPGNNKIQWQQSSVNDHITTQPSLEVNQVEGLHCNKAAINQSLEKNKHFGSIKQAQQSQHDILTQRQQSGINPVHMRPSLDVFQREQLDAINPELKQQTLGLQKQRQQSPTSHEEEWQQPKLIHMQGSQSAINRHIMAHSPANSAEQGTEQEEGVETSASNSIHQQQQSPNTTGVYQQSSDNTQACDDSENHSAERQPLTVHGQTRFSSPQSSDQSHSSLFVISEEERHKRSGICGPCSTQLSAESPDSQHVKDQQSGDIKQDLNQLSTGNSTEQSALEKTGNSTEQSALEKTGNSTEQSALEKTGNSTEQSALEKTGEGEVTHRVSTYLHVTDSLRAVSNQKTDDGTVACTMFSTSPPPFSCPSPPSQAISGTVATHGYGTTSGSFPAPLEQRMKRKESYQRRHTALGVVRHSNVLLTQSTMSPCTFRERSNTWPIEDRNRKRHQTNMNRQDSLDSICPDEPNCVTIFRDNSHPVPEVRREPVKNICSYLSLGSTLRFSLPRDFRVLCSSPTDLQSSEESETPQSTLVLTDSTNQPSLQSLPAGSNSDFALSLQPAVEAQPITAHNLQGKSNHQRFLMLDKVILDPNHESEEQQHDKIQQRAYSQKTVIPAKEFCTCEEAKQQDMEKHTSGEVKGPFTVGHVSTTDSCSLPLGPASCCSHKCLSIHTRIKDLNGHMYHASKYMQWNCETNSVLLEIKDLPNQLTDSKLSPIKSNRVVICGERDCAVCGSVLVENSVEAPQLSHWQFQEEEEELQDIWKERVDDMASDWAVESGKGQKAGLSVQINEGPVALSLHG